MQPNLLKLFYNDEHMREAVKEFLIETVAHEALKAVMERGDVSGFADANDVINKAFITLKEEFSDDPKPITSNSR